MIATGNSPEFYANPMPLLFVDDVIDVLLRVLLPEIAYFLGTTRRVLYFC